MLAQTKARVPGVDEEEDLLDEDEENLSADELAAIDQAWREEIARRVARVRSGEAVWIPSEEVHAMMRARLAALAAGR
jgi:mannose-6-phosphate isomerase class I